MTNYKTGHDAEQVAADFLKQQGFKVQAINWHTKYCEIDVVAEKDRTMHFVEVKYRRNNAFGSGIDYITPKKLKQMQFAAEMWVMDNDWQGAYQLSVVEVGGQNFTEIRLLTDL